MMAGVPTKAPGFLILVFSMRLQNCADRQLTKPSAHFFSHGVSLAMGSIYSKWSYCVKNEVYPLGDSPEEILVGSRYRGSAFKHPVSH